MKFANYQNHSIIQNTKLYHKYFNNFGGLLDFGWWPGLRLGNWRLYEEALEQHIDATDYDYDILAGISGKISIPVNVNSCHKNHKNRTLMEFNEDISHKIPLYIWNYLKSTTGENVSDIVVIGVNTPFYDVSITHLFHGGKPIINHSHLFISAALFGKGSNILH